MLVRKMKQMKAVYDQHFNATTYLGLDVELQNIILNRQSCRFLHDFTKGIGKTRLSVTAAAFDLL